MEPTTDPLVVEHLAELAMLVVLLLLRTWNRRACAEQDRIARRLDRIEDRIDRLDERAESEAP